MYYVIHVYVCVCNSMMCAHIIHVVMNKHLF